MSTTRDEVRRRYAEAAVAASRGAREGAQAFDSDCCGAGGCATGPAVQEIFGPGLYPERDRDELPDAATLASLGCGNPTAVADLQKGETVLDLGAGGGIDVLLSARRVGASGFVFGLDMTDEMLDLAERNRAEAGVTNVRFLKGFIEDVPLEDSTIDVIISNCVINLSTEKAAVFSEMARLLRPGGRIGISDVVASDDLSPEDRAERGSHVGCIAGALSFAEYRQGLASSGFTDISIQATHPVADGMFGAIVKARRA